MARHSLSHRPRCPFHPTREATDRCDRCYTLVSTEALEEHDLRRLCPPCIDALDLAEQVREDARLTPRNLWRRFRDIDYRVAAIGFAVVAVILGAGAFMVWITARAEPDPLLIRRARVGFTQNFDVDNEGLDFVEVIKNGVASATSQSPDPLHIIERLHDGLPDTPVPPWRSADAVFPIDISLTGLAPELLSKVVIWNHSNEDSSTYIREFELYITTPAEPDRIARRVLIGTFTALPTDAKQVFLLDQPVLTTTTIVRVLDNYGGAYISAAEIGLFNPTVNTSFGNPNISQGPLP
jgi:hypothetical protein